MGNTTLNNFEKIKNTAIDFYNEKKKNFDSNTILLAEDCFMLLLCNEYNMDEMGITKILAFNALRPFKNEIDKLLKGEKYSKEAIKEYVSIYEKIQYFDILKILYTAEEIEKIKNASL